MEISICSLFCFFWKLPLPFWWLLHEWIIWNNFWLLIKQHIWILGESIVIEFIEFMTRVANASTINFREVDPLNIEGIWNGGGRVTYLCNIGLICNRIWKVGLNHQTWPFAVLLLLIICYRLVVVVFWKDVTLLVQSLIHSILFPALCPIFLLRNIFINSFILTNFNVQ